MLRALSYSLEPTDSMQLDAISVCTFQLMRKAVANMAELRTCDMGATLNVISWIMEDCATISGKCYRI